MPAGDRNEGDLFGVVPNLLDEGGCLFDDFVKPILRPLKSGTTSQTGNQSEEISTDLSGVHFVDGNNELPDAESEGQESVLASLTVFGDTSLEFTGTSGNDEDGTIGLGSTGNHVLDEISVSGSINDLEESEPCLSGATRQQEATHSDIVLRGFELPKGDVDCDTTLTLGLQLVEYPC